MLTDLIYILVLNFFFKVLGRICKLNHQRVMVDPILLIVLIYNLPKTFQITLIGLDFPDCPD